MINPFTSRQPITPVFGANQPQKPQQTNRRKFLLGALLAGSSLAVGGALLRQPQTDTFVKAPKSVVQVGHKDESEAAKRFDTLVEHYFNEPPQSVAALEKYQKDLAAINAKQMDQQYQGLYMLFDHHLKREHFESTEGAGLKALGVDMSHTHHQEGICADFEVYPKPSEALLKGGVGKKVYDAMLTLDNFINLDSEGLSRLAKHHFDTIEAEMQKLADEIAPGQNWRDVYMELRKNHPGKDELLDVYREEVKKADQFLKDQNLITVPKNQLQVIETPDYYRDSIPYAAYLGGWNGTGTFMVTTVIDEDPEKIEEQLRAHNYGFIPPVVVHEAFPGHHLQHVHNSLVKIDETNPKNRTMARVIGLTPRNIFFIEGWGVYSEEMMRENGYYTKPEQKLFALRNILWRAARAWIDPQVHTGKMKYEEAVDFLVDNVLLERDRAEIEVNRYFQRPTDVASYMVGMLQIKQLREQVQNTEKDGFALKGFHDNLLKGKNLPVPVLAKMRFNQDLNLHIPAEAKDANKTKAR